MDKKIIENIKKTLDASLPKQATAMLYGSQARMIMGSVLLIMIMGSVLLIIFMIMGISKTKPRMRHLINVKKPHFLCFEA